MFTISDIKFSHNWLKTEFLAALCTEKELKTLTPKSWRKGWSNWGKGQKDPHLREIHQRLMCHSPQVAQSNYLVPDVENAGQIGRKVLGEEVEVPQQSKEGEQTIEVEQPKEGKQTEEMQHTEDVEQTEAVEQAWHIQQAEDVPPTKKGVVKVKQGNFTYTQRQIIKNALYVDGAPPSSLTNETISQAKEKSQLFSDLYDGLVTQFDNRNWKANNCIRKSLMPKKKKKEIKKMCKVQKF